MSAPPAPPPTADTSALRDLISDLEVSLTALPLHRALEHIAAWHRRLAGSEQPALQAVAADLLSLRDLLTAPALEAPAISRALVALGGRTREAAALAEDGPTHRAVARLGDLLFHAGHALSPPTRR